MNPVQDFNTGPTDEQFMGRALQLAACGGSRVSPNPFVGAVIVYVGRIIGEGYHRQFGGPHAEVNAVASVREEDRHLLGKSTMYVTLEPCSHYGKTPPCTELIISHGIPRVAVALEDPFLKDYVSGIGRLREAGVKVATGLRRGEAAFQNRRFLTAHTLKRPYILLKWAQSSDGFMGRKGERVKISSPLTLTAMHRERAFYDAILVGTNTVITDNPSLTCRLWPSRGERPRPVTFDSPRLPADAVIIDKNTILINKETPLPRVMENLYSEHGVTSLMVEGGAETLRKFIDAGLFDEVRIERADITLENGIESPERPLLASLPPGYRLETEKIGHSTIFRYYVKNY